MRKHAIMITDDSEPDRYLLKRLIKRTSFTGDIIEAADGAEALDLLRDRGEKYVAQSEYYPPVLIFLDINMPIMGGFEFLEKFDKLRRERIGLKSVVFTMFSSSERKEDRERANSYDCVGGYVTKGSLSKESLQSLIDSYCIG